MKESTDGRARILTCSDFGLTNCCSDCKEYVVFPPKGYSSYVWAYFCCLHLKDGAHLSLERWKEVYDPSELEPKRYEPKKYEKKPVDIPDFDDLF